MATSLRAPDTTDGGTPRSADSGRVALLRALERPAREAWVVERDGAFEVLDAPPARREGARVGFLPAMRPSDLGDRSFREEHGLRYACLSGGMANGIGSVDLVLAMARAGMAGFFGAAGLPLDAVARAVDRLREEAGGLPFGVNFIHAPGEPSWEEGLADLLLDRGVRLAEASAFLDLTPAVVRWRLKGLREGPGGRPLPANRLVAKASRVEVASRFLSPPPPAIVRDLLAAGRITAEEARLAPRVPVAADLTVEADSGGHTDNRPLVALLPTMLALRDRIMERYTCAGPLRVGAAGGIATPASAAAAFAMGAAWVLTGSVNQACVEAGTSDAVRGMLAEAGQADTAMAPAADMFEMGVKVQVLKRGTMFPMRAQRLHDLWRAHGSLDALPPADRENLERNLFRAPLAAIEARTREFWLRRDPAAWAAAEGDPRARMALVFRWYLGMSSEWANGGEPDRRLDYQVWCGPSMGAFNEWARGSFLEAPAGRRAAVVARNLLHGAAVLLRVQALRAQGVEVPAEALRAPPLEPPVLDERERP